MLTLATGSFICEYFRQWIGKKVTLGVGARIGDLWDGDKDVTHAIGSRTISLYGVAARRGHPTRAFEPPRGNKDDEPCMGTQGTYAF
jgi:hypothetical protein